MSKWHKWKEGKKRDHAFNKLVPQLPPSPTPEFGGYSQDTKPCAYCMGQKVIVQNFGAEGIGTYPCDRCAGTGIEPPKWHDET